LEILTGDKVVLGFFDFGLAQAMFFKHEVVGIKVAADFKHLLLLRHACIISFLGYSSRGLAAEERDEK
jgi:hypothetical protein